MQSILSWKLALALSLGLSAFSCGDNGGDDEDPPDLQPGDGDGCNPNPATSLEILNNCAPASVERRQFNNDERLPENYVPGQPLPELP